MLEFFRRYQRGFFLFVTALIIVSFAFFGTFDAIHSSKEKEDPLAFIAIDGSKVFASKVELLSRFLELDAIQNREKGGVVDRDFLETGLSHLIVNSSFDLLEEGLDRSLKRAKRYVPYAHPAAPQVSARFIWEKAMPSIVEDLDQLRLEERASPQVFDRLSRLYLAQKLCPPQTLKQILLYQARPLSFDPRLGSDDLSLFGFHSLSEWFGSRFSFLIASFIVNSARAAEEKGFQVTSSEVVFDLEKHGIVSSLKQKGMSAQFSLKEIKEIWKEVMLFRKYFEQIDQAMVVDLPFYQKWTPMTHTTAQVDLYSLPKNLQIQRDEDLISLEIYLQKVGKKKSPLDIPAVFFSLEEVEKKAPLLVQSKYRVKIAACDEKQAALKAPFQDLWDWEVVHWKELVKEFPFLAGKTPEEAFDTLSFSQKERLDQKARLAWIQDHPEVLQELLAQTLGEEHTIWVSSKKSSLPGILNVKAFEALLQSSSEVFPEPLFYSEGGWSYRIEKAELIAPPHLLSWAEAKEEGIMAEIEKDFLQKEYPKIREKFPKQFQNRDGSFKPFFSVQIEVGKLFFRSVFEALGEKGASNRFASHAQRALTALEKNPEDLCWVQTGKDLFQEQFLFEKKSQSIGRREAIRSSLEELFQMEAGKWSSIHQHPQGKITFYHLQEKTSEEKVAREERGLERVLLARDAKQFFAQKILDRQIQHRALWVQREEK